MAEYIERASAVHAINSKHRPENSVAQNRLLALAVHDVFKIPAADVAPVRHGRWVEDGGGKWHCSECGYKMEVEDDYFDPNGFPIRFCANCGARMDGGADNATW